MTDQQHYRKFVRDNASKTQMYNDILEELLASYRTEIHIAKDENDYAKITIGTNFLCKYIVQLVNDMVEYIGENEGREESEDKYKEDIGL